jgi:hypothetical protein
MMMMMMMMMMMRSVGAGCPELERGELHRLSGWVI